MIKMPTLEFGGESTQDRQDNETGRLQMKFHSMQKIERNVQGWWR
jgi:hypothetical protein